MANDNCPRCVSDVAVTFHCDVKLEKVPASESSRAGNTVNDLVVDAEKNMAGKSVHQRRRRTGAVSRENRRGHRIEFCCRDTHANVRSLKRVQRQTGDVSCPFHAVQILRGFDRHRPPLNLRCLPLFR